MAAPVEVSYLWTTGGGGDDDAAYTVTDWANIGKILGGTSGSQGIVPNYLNCYSIATGTNTVTVNTGGALVDGKPHMCSTAGDLTIPNASPAGNTRIDRIALRATWGATQNVRITRVNGSSDNPPTAPAYATTPGTSYDLPLWQVTVNVDGTITASTDERYYSSCGLSGSNLQTGACGRLAIKAGGVNTADIANDAVDDTKVGNRVPQFYRRKGGNSASWHTAGATTYTPTAVRMQAGASTLTDSDGVIPFPVAFSYAPLVFLQVEKSGTDQYAVVDSVVASAVYVTTYNAAGAPITDVKVYWFAVGTE